MSSENLDDFGKQENRRSHHHAYDDGIIENMKQYFRVEDDQDALIKYIKENTHEDKRDALFCDISEKPAQLGICFEFKVPH